MSLIQTLVKKLQRNNEGQRAKAAAELRDLAKAGPQNCTAIADAGGFPALVRVLDSSTHGPTLMAAAEALGYASAISPESGMAIAAAGGIASLVRLLGSSDASVVNTATSALNYLAETSP